MTIQRISTPVRVWLPAARHLALIVREQLDIGDRVRALHAGRTGTVMKVYPDGSACITWDDKPSPIGLGHERVPRSLLIVTGASVTESEGGEA
jgi:hypothetical protein